MRHLLFAACLLLPVSAMADTTIEIREFSFTPAEVTVTVGSTITWVNRDDTPHLVADADTPRRMKSPPLDTGESFSFVARTAGVIRYFCSLHPHMQGTVVVR